MPLREIKFWELVIVGQKHYRLLQPRYEWNLEDS